MKTGLFFAISAVVLLCTACTKLVPQRPAACCAAPGYSRAQVEAVLGPPSPPEPSSKVHPFPSPPPDAPIYTTEHGYLTVHYTGVKGLATRLSMDFYEGKAPDDAFSIMSGFMPDDTVDLKADVVGKTANIRAYRSAKLAKALPASRGMLYVECKGPNPATLCDTTDVVLGAP